MGLLNLNLPNGYSNWNLYNYSSNFPYFTGFPACSLVK